MTQFQYEFIQKIYPQINGYLVEHNDNGIVIEKHSESVRNLTMDVYSLAIDGVGWMCTGPIDLLDQKCVYEEFYGDVLFTGLGLGLCIKYATLNPNIRSITVLEKDQRIIDLIAPLLEDVPRLTIINTDAYNWDPDRGYNCIYHDIVHDPDDEDSYIRLKEKYAPYADNQYYWGHELRRVMLQWQ